MKQKTLLILILFSLFLIPTLVNARTSCDDYCERGIYYSDGSYNTRTEECDYSIERCESGCNARGTECAVTEIIQEYETKTCDPYCEDGVYYGRGAYNRETGECEYQYRNKCEEGCNRIGTECYQSEAVEMSCPDYCSDDTYYYGGSYDEEARRCRYRGREVCRYGCDLRQDNCAEPGQVIEYVESKEKTCRDSDNGRDFEEKGKVLWVYGNEEGTLSDHCVGSTLVEYYCDNDIRAAAYKECSEDGMLCKDAKCIELVEGYCIDPDGNDLTTKAWADGTNAWNTGLVSWGDYCSETPEGGSTETGDYIHEAICLETNDEYYEVRYAGVKKCEDGCVDGICIGSGEAEVVEELKEETTACSSGCSCMTREAGAERFSQPEMCSQRPCDYASDGTTMYCIKGEVEKAITRRRINANLKSELGIEKKENAYFLKRANKSYKIKSPEDAISQYVKGIEELESINVTLEKETPVYEIRIRRKARLLGFIPVNLRIKFRINADDLTLIEEKRPWWTFLVSDKEEKESESIDLCGNNVCDKGEGKTCTEDCGVLCGNNKCDPTDFTICPWDCGIECGDTICSTGESSENCPQDCFGDCGDGTCTQNEWGMCVIDCPICGDGICTLPKENMVTCQNDCAVCGDGIVMVGEGIVDDIPSCPEDVFNGCGDGKCFGNEESVLCPQDCGGYVCGDGGCNPGESPTKCPEDCEPYACGNEICEPGEGPTICPEDCTPNCGDKICDGGESFENCKPDCGFCNDGICGLNEAVETCPEDCDAKCGNNKCEGGESLESCPADCNQTCLEGCTTTCGDGICNKADLKSGCSLDCGLNCGDGICNKQETAKNCPQDCPPVEIDASLYVGKTPYDEMSQCGDGVCDENENQKKCHQDCHGTCPDGICGFGENSGNCKFDCITTCGNGICEELEGVETCPLDCGPYCDDGTCNRGEWPKTCYIDCDDIICGDDVCSPGESQEFCPLDCYVIICGDGVCEKGENPESCADDCASVCGDNICNGIEDYLNCAWDCGYCGDGVCSPNEECTLDCTSACGDGICESAESCPIDCAGS